MQPQDNDFPIDQVQGGVVPTSAGDQGLPQQPLAGGSTFQPQAGGISAAQPGWMADAQNDENQLNAAAAQPEPVQPQEPVQPSMPEANPLLAQDQAQPVQPQEPAPMPVQPPMEQPPVQDSQLPGQPGPQMAAKEPPQYEQPVVTAAAATQAMPMQTTDPYAQPQPQPGLPGSDSLGQAVVGMEAQQPQPQQQMPEGTYGPPPKKGGKGKIIFIIVGIIIGLAAIGAGVFFFLSKRTATNTTPTPSQTQTETQTNTTPSPSAGPVTPPAGYVTITKQCYSFALFDPNTVPTDQACSFVDATFGKKQASKISVEPTTESFKTIDEVMAVFKPTVTVVSENKITLGGFDAVQVVYKATDGQTYSKVFTLVVGKNYQQNGQAVTALALTTSYQEQFDITVTGNVISTWIWQ